MTKPKETLPPPTQSETLLPCPFCKQAVHIIKGQTEGSCDWIEHLSPTEECGLEFSDFNLTGDLATAWNTRLQSIPEPLSDEGLAERHAELQHWFFQKLNPEQRTAFLFAAGVAPRTCDLTLGMQHQALRLVSAALSIPRLEAGKQPMKIIPGDKITLEDEHGIYSAPEAGRVTEANEGELEDLFFDALYDCNIGMGVATRRAAKACVAALKANPLSSTSAPDGEDR